MGFKPLLPMINVSRLFIGGVLVGASLGFVADHIASRSLVNRYQAPSTAQTSYTLPTIPADGTGTGP